MHCTQGERGLGGFGLEGVAMHCCKPILGADRLDAMKLLVDSLYCKQEEQWAGCTTPLPCEWELRHLMTSMQQA